MKGLKKRNFRLKDAVSVEDKFKARNLTDTRWASRLLADELKRMFPAPDGERRVFARPGAITSKLRRAWGLEVAEEGRRRARVGRPPSRRRRDRTRGDDRRPAAGDDQGNSAAASEKGEPTISFTLRRPWPRFRAEAERVVYGENGIGGVFVSRAERRRARGKAHDATVKQVREIDGEEDRVRAQGDRKADAKKIWKGFQRRRPTEGSPIRQSCATNWWTRCAHGSPPASQRVPINCRVRPKATSSAKSAF